MHYYFEEKPFFSQFTENQLPGFGPPFILCQKHAVRSFPFKVLVLIRLPSKWLTFANKRLGQQSCGAHILFVTSYCRHLNLKADKTVKLSI